MNTQYDIQKLIALRKLTTALAEYFSRQLSGYLAHLSPLLSPRGLLGELIRGEKQTAKGADVAFQELLKLYQQVAPISPFQTSPDIKAPLDIFGATPEISTATYSYVPEGGTKKITVRCPLKWVLSYKDLGPQRLRELIASHGRSGGLELQAALLHYLVMRVIAARPSGAAPILAALRFPVSFGTVEEFGKLPVTYLVAPISTVRPPDDIILMNTEIAGTSTFEEVANLDDIVNLSDPLSTEIRRIAEEYAGAMLASPGSGGTDSARQSEAPQSTIAN